MLAKYNLSIYYYNRLCRALLKQQEKLGLHPALIFKIPLHLPHEFFWYVRWSFYRPGID